MKFNLFYPKTVITYQITIPKVPRKMVSENTDQTG